MKFSTSKLNSAAWAVALAATLFCAPRAMADVRAFTFTYETTTMSQGHLEYEQWVTWSQDKADDPSLDRFDFRHEIEYGVTDAFQIAVYVSDWRVENGASVNDKTKWKDVSVEAIYSLSDPTADPLGVALYGEVKLGDEFAEIEAKLLLQKNIGKWIIAWNGIFEAEWEGESFHEDKGEIGQAIGVSYQVTPKWTLGAELLHEVGIDDWSEWGDNVVYFGPTTTVRGNGWWFGVTQLFQVTDIDSEADFQTRMIIGIDF